MSTESPQFDLPRAIDRHLATLCKLYALHGNRDLQKIIVNAQVRMQENWSRDNWNDGIYGHALYLTLPESIFLVIVDRANEIQNQIKDDLNKIQKSKNEFIEEVFIEMEIAESSEWRKDSGLLLAGKAPPPSDATKRIWGDDGFRVFLSHKSENKKETAVLKKSLGLFGVTSFVAHEDIHPTQSWQSEIEIALESMDGFVALMTRDFHESEWTDQEIGYAFARRVPIIAVRLGRDPYGFIGRFQALSCDWTTAPQEIVRIFIKDERMFSSFISALRKCPSWDAGNILGEILPAISILTLPQIDQLVLAYNETKELRGSFAFNGGRPRYHGPGLVNHLHRLGTRRFKYSPKGLIEEES